MVYDSIINKGLKSLNRTAGFRIWKVSNGTPKRDIFICISWLEGLSFSGDDRDILKEEVNGIFWKRKSTGYSERGSQRDILKEEVKTYLMSQRQRLPLDLKIHSHLRICSLWLFQCARSSTLPCLDPELQDSSCGIPSVQQIKVGQVSLCSYLHFWHSFLTLYLMTSYFSLCIFDFVCLTFNFWLCMFDFQFLTLYVWLSIFDLLLWLSNFDFNFWLSI